MNKVLFAVLIIVLSLKLNAQSNSSFGWLPKINTSTKVNNNTKWVNSIEARERLYKKQLEFKHKLVDVTSVISFKTNINQSFNIGGVVRFSTKNTVYRLLQHYNFITSFNGLKLANRIGFEQFFANNTQPKYRTRYRATLQKSLSGDRVDAKEFYLKYTNEYLYNFNKKDLEIRFAPYLGYKISKNEKIEFGFEYRLSNFLNNLTKNNLWFRTTWYLVL